jgi:hypothetical protein
MNKLIIFIYDNINSSFKNLDGAFTLKALNLRIEVSNKIAKKII